MKNTKTTLMELTKQYRSVLMKCILLNGFILGFSVPAFAEPNIDGFLKNSSVSEIFKDLEITTSSEVQGNYTGEWSGGVNHKHIYQGSITGADTVKFYHVALYLNVDNQGMKAGNFSVKNTKFNADTSAITGGRFIIRQEDEVNVVEGTKVEFENSEVYLKDSDIESKGDMVIKGTNLTYSCQDCYQYNIDGSFKDVGDNILMGHNISIEGSQVVLGDKERQKSEEKSEESYMGANHNLTIDASSVVLNGKSMLAYEGEMEECVLLEPPTTITNGVGAISIKNASTLTLNDDSSLKIGMEEDDEGNPMDSRASLSISDSTINMNKNAKIEFALVNKEGTSISNSTINMTGKSSMSLNDMTLDSGSKINMNDASSVVAENVALNDSYINMKDNSVLDVYNVTFDGGVIYSSDNSKVYIKDDRGENSLTLNGTTITTSIFSNSISNLVKFLGTVRFSGLFDPATADVADPEDPETPAEVIKGDYDDEITYNINNNGILRYTDDKYLYDSTMHNGTYGKNTINFKGGTLDLRNGAATAIHLASLSLADGTTSSIYADVDLANEKMDRLTADNISVGTGAKLNIAGLNLISDATNEKTSITFTENENLKDATAYTGETTGLKALSPVYTYDVAYNNGIFEFTRLGSGESSNDYNPAVYSSTTVSQNVGLLSSNINSIAFAGLSGENSSPQGRSGGDLPTMGNTWVKLVGFDENVDFDSFQTIDSQVFSVIGGMTTDKVNLGSSDMTFGAYAGYLNGKQKYTGNKVEQNGGYFGLSTSWTKDRLFVDGTINAGFIRNEAKHSFGTDKYNTYWTGAAAKVGYNYALTDTLTFVPSFYTGYTMVATKDYTSVSGVRIENDKTHIFEFAPGLKLSQQFNNDWTGFIQGKYAILKNHEGDVTADDIALPNISTDNYAEYGIGLDKVLTDNWTLSLTANRRDGGRQGWNGSVEFKYNF